MGNSCKKLRKATKANYIHAINKDGNHFLVRYISSEKLLSFLTNNRLDPIDLLRCRIIPKKEPILCEIFGDFNLGYPVVGRCYYSTTGRVVEVLEVTTVSPTYGRRGIDFIAIRKEYLNRKALDGLHKIHDKI